MNWIFELKSKIISFLDRLKSKTKPGYFKYSLTGDLFNERIHWGLGQTVFAAKIYYMLREIQNLKNEDKKAMADYIRSFQKKNGYIYDDLIQRNSWFRRVCYSCKSLDFNNFFGEQTKRAETRQSFAALMCLGESPDLPCLHIPYTKEGIKEYLNKLNWSKPWAAGSHFSHLIFFLEMNKKFFDVYKEQSDELIDFAISEVNNLQSHKDGSWYKGNNISSQQKINGAMKVLTGLSIVDKLNFQFSEKLIDLCIKAINDEGACDNFNIVYVLYCCAKLTDYRNEEIKKFCLNRLKIYKEHFKNKEGGFSFYRNKANDIYYGAKITKGLDEPDIHGTVMFLWGIAIISRILELDKEMVWNLPIT